MTSFLKRKYETRLRHAGRPRTKSWEGDRPERARGVPGPAAAGAGREEGRAALGRAHGARAVDAHGPAARAA